MSTYTSPESLVESSWLAEHLNDPNIRIVESNEDILLYDTGHIPNAVHIENLGVDPGDETIVYGRIGERSSHTWFVLTYLLGFPHVKNYDGSWTEWGNSVRVPIEKGS
jgi:3-mercaptopyruvate sulfurtransferase SseA